MNITGVVVVVVAVVVVVVAVVVVVVAVVSVVVAVVLVAVAVVAVDVVVVALSKTCTSPCTIPGVHVPGEDVIILFASLLSKHLLTWEPGEPSMTFASSHSPFVQSQSHVFTFPFRSTVASVVQSVKPAPSIPIPP